jgi:Tfp pilus assembly protein PilP
VKRLLPLMVTLAVCTAATAHATSEESEAPTAAEKRAPLNGAKSVAERDPFRPFTLDLRRQVRAPRSPLQRYELRQLTLAATIWDASPPRAMVQDSAGMGYIVTIGTPMGSNGGYVTAIQPERLVVEERVVDYYGKESVSRVVMRTPQEEGAKNSRERQ